MRPGGFRASMEGASSRVVGEDGLPKGGGGGSARGKDRRLAFLSGMDTRKAPLQSGGQDKHAPNVPVYRERKERPQVIDPRRMRVDNSMAADRLAAMRSRGNLRPMSSREVYEEGVTATEERSTSRRNKIRYTIRDRDPRKRFAPGGREAATKAARKAGAAEAVDTRLMKEVEGQERNTAKGRMKSAGLRHLARTQGKGDQDLLAQGDLEEEFTTNNAYNARMVAMGKNKIMRRTPRGMETMEEAEGVHEGEALAAAMEEEGQVEDVQNRRNKPGVRAKDKVVFMGEEDEGGHLEDEDYDKEKDLRLARTEGSRRLGLRGRPRPRPMTPSREDNGSAGEDQGDISSGKRRLPVKWGREAARAYSQGEVTEGENPEPTRRSCIGVRPRNRNTRGAGAGAGEDWGHEDTRGGENQAWRPALQPKASRGGTLAGDQGLLEGGEDLDPRPQVQGRKPRHLQGTRHLRRGGEDEEDLGREGLDLPGRHLPPKKRGHRRVTAEEDHLEGRAMRDDEDLLEKANLKKSLRRKAGSRVHPLGGGSFGEDTLVVGGEEVAEGDLPLTRSGPAMMKKAPKSRRGLAFTGDLEATRLEDHFEEEARVRGRLPHRKRGGISTFVEADGAGGGEEATTVAGSRGRVAPKARRGVVIEGEAPGEGEAGDEALASLRGGKTGSRKGILRREVQSPVDTVILEADETQARRRRGRRSMAATGRAGRWVKVEDGGDLDVLDEDARPGAGSGFKGRPPPGMVPNLDGIVAPGDILDDGGGGRGWSLSSRPFGL